MDILIIGGTRFLGRALVDSALAYGHTVTLFNRGKTNPNVYPDLETIIGDRETDLDKLDGRSWDAVIDTCGYVPRIVRLSAQALKDKAQHYTFISSISVYPILGAPNRDENSELLTIEDETIEDITNESYGALKVLCENAVQEAFPDTSLIIRPGLIVGAYDPTNRFTYWVTRTANGGEAIAPPAEQPVQFVDARDLADFTINRIEANSSEPYNVTGPDKYLTFGEWLSVAKDALGSDVTYHHVTDDFLKAHEIGEFMELPLWINLPEAEQFMTFNVDKALNDGLVFRPLADTIRDTYQWAKDLPDNTLKPADLPAEKEELLLNALQD
jgi:2'-hydroxyisoflavone reductase